MKKLCRLIWKYWQSDEKKKAYGYLAAILVLTVAAVYMTLKINDWFNSFYSALQGYDSEGVYHGLIQFTVYAFLYIAFSVYAYYLSQKLALSWRRWMTSEYLGKWLSHTMYYQMEMFSKGRGDNPDQRISEDINQFTSTALSIIRGMLKAVTTIICFIFILWELSDPLSFNFLGTTWHVYGYLVWVALLYSILGTWVTHKLGRRLVGLNYEQQKREADFRFGMVRLRDTAESVAFYHGEKEEEKRLSKNFERIFRNMIRIIRKEKQLSWLTNSYGQIAIIFPFIVAAPRYLTKDISLGGLMQIANCFGKVQESMSYFVDVYTTLAEWRACADRLLAFSSHMKDMEKNVETARRDLHWKEGKDILALSHVNVLLPSGKELLHDVNVSIEKGDRVMLKGPSGAGKSTFLRVLAGFWPFAGGTVEEPRGSRMFIPQKPYIPIGTLREAASYPGAAPDEETLRNLMQECGLSHFIPSLDKEADWGHILSLGEQQKLAFMRIFIRKPEWVFLDEATSAMDEDTENYMYKRLASMPLTIISVGHRSTLDKWHTRKLVIDNGKMREA